MSTRSPTPRRVAPDVMRTLALLGVIVMNYHGFLNARMLGDGFWDRLFHPFDGVLSTRFAATFVLMAGIGVALMASNALRAEDRIGLGSMRSRLARRGLLLYAAGLALNHAWGGTILFYYGAYLIIAAVIVGLSDRALVVLATGTIIATGGLNAWLSSRPSDSERIEWLDPREIDTIADLIGRTFTGYTHPVLPWLAFFIAGIVVGRHVERFQRHARSIALIGGLLTAGTYLIHHVVSDHVTDGSGFEGFIGTEPFQRGLGYSVTTIAIAITSFALVCVFVERFATTRLVRVLQRAGQMTLTAYLLHVVVYYVLFRWWSIIDARGLAIALIVSTTLWIAVVLGSSWWRHRIGLGPAERLYRLIGG